MSQDHPLHRACLDGHLSRVQELLQTDEGCSSLMLADADGRQPLHWAVTSDEKREIVEALLGAGDVDVNAPDGSGWTPLMIASSSGARRLVQTLLQRYVLCLTPGAQTSTQATASTSPRCTMQAARTMRTLCVSSWCMART